MDTIASPAIPYGFCNCGCGKPAPLARKTFSARGWIKGRPIRFILGHHKQSLLLGPAAIFEDNHARILLTHGSCCCVDIEDTDLDQYKWHLGGDGYARRGASVSSSGPHIIRMHRVILERKLNRPLLRNEECDHRDGNRLDNRRCNLRLATHQQNQQNQKRRGDNTSGFRGVSFDRSRNKWAAEIQGRFLGRFDTPDAAARVYETAAGRVYGEFRRRS